MNGRKMDMVILQMVLYVMLMLCILEVGIVVGLLNQGYCKDFLGSLLKVGIMGLLKFGCKE
jgi:hypothetical protein